MPDLIPTLLFPSNIQQNGTSMRLFFTFYRDFVCMFMCALARACVRASVCARMRVCTLACVFMCARERERTAIFYQISLLSFEMQDVLSFSIFDFFLVACTRLYKPFCRSVGRLVGRSVGRSVAVHDARDLWRSALSLKNSKFKKIEKLVNLAAGHL